MAQFTALFYFRLTTIQYLHLHIFGLYSNLDECCFSLNEVTTSSFQHIMPGQVLLFLLDESQDNREEWIAVCTDDRFLWMNLQDNRKVNYSWTVREGLFARLDRTGQTVVYCCWFVSVLYEEARVWSILSFECVGLRLACSLETSK